MDDILTPVSTTYLKPRKDEEPLFTEVKSPRTVEPSPPKPIAISSADDALDALRSQPDYSSLISVLNVLSRDHGDASSFRLHVPSPKGAAIVQTLVTEIAPNYWTLLYEDSEKDHVYHGGSSVSDSRDLELFLQCLRSVTGINALVSHLKALIQGFMSSSRDSRRPDVSLHISIFLDILAAVLRGDSAIRQIWIASSSELGTQALKKVQSQALVSILTSGKLVSVTGEAAEILGRDQVRVETRWITDGLEVSKWIGRNVASWANTEPEDTGLQFCSDLFQRAMSLGYPGELRLLSGLLSSHLTIPQRV
jgi:telomere length regulation protein